MTLDNMFAAARGKMTDDKKYEVGQISEKTGLQKQPDGSWAPPRNKEIGNVGKFEEKQKEAKKAAAEEKLKQQRAEGEANAAAFQKKVESGEIVYNQKTGKFEENNSNGSWTPPKKGGKKPTENSKSDIISKMSPEHKAAVMAGKTYRHVDNKTGVTDITKADLEAAENRAANEKADKERADRTAKADSKASAARQEAEARHLSGVEMKDFFLAKAYEGTSVEMTQRGLEAQGFELLEANDDVNVYERPEGGRITMKLEGNRIKSADYQTPAETAREARSERANPAGSKEPPKRESVSAGRMQKDLDGNFWSRPDDFKEDITSRGWDVEEMNSEYAVISNEAGSQYEVRFDPHSDGGSLTVNTFKPLMIDEDDDDVEDSAIGSRQLTRDTKIRIRK